jgi:hypothetical protein
VAIAEAFADRGRLGIGAGYESAATLAALRAALRSGNVARAACVPLLSTGPQLSALSRQAHVPKRP